MSMDFIARGAVYVYCNGTPIYQIGDYGNGQLHLCSECYSASGRISAACDCDCLASFSAEPVLAVTFTPLAATQRPLLHQVQHNPNQVKMFAISGIFTLALQLSFRWRD